MDAGFDKSNFKQNREFIRLTIFLLIWRNYTVTLSNHQGQIKDNFKFVFNKKNTKNWMKTEKKNRKFKLIETNLYRQHATQSKHEKVIKIESPEYLDYKI